MMQTFTPSRGRERWNWEGAEGHSMKFGFGLLLILMELAVNVEHCHSSLIEAN